MTARQEHFPVHADILVSDDTPTIGVFIQCGCSRNPRVRGLHITQEAIEFFRRSAPSPDMVVLSYRCPQGCKQKIKVTARMLYFAA